MQNFGRMSRNCERLESSIYCCMALMSTERQSVKRQMWMADFDRSKKFSLIGRVHLENRLTDILGIKADLADRAMLRPEVLERAERELILVF